MPAAAEVLRDLRSRFDHGKTVVLRLWECSLGCTPVLDVADAKRRCPGCSAMEVCVTSEMTQRERPASALRADVPRAIFLNGRCSEPSRLENVERSTRYPQLSKGLFVDVFTGHNVTSSGVGIIFDDSGRRKYRRMGAFAHDAWVWRQRGSKSRRLHPCPAVKDWAQQYAQARWRMASDGGFFAAPTTHATDLNTEQLVRMASAWRGRFINSSWNCYQSDWNQALDAQSAYVKLLLVKDSRPAFRECSIWGSLYNQVHTAWNFTVWAQKQPRPALPFAALFYVNDTTSAQMGHRSEQPLLEARARASASRAYCDARQAQRALARRIEQTLPVLQYRPTSECWDAAAAGKRMAMRGARGADFLELPPADVLC